MVDYIETEELLKDDDNVRILSAANLNECTTYMSAAPVDVQCPYHQQCIAGRVAMCGYSCPHCRGFILWTKLILSGLECILQKNYNTPKLRILFWIKGRKFRFRFYS